MRCFAGPSSTKERNNDAPSSAIHLLLLSVHYSDFNKQLDCSGKQWDYFETVLNGTPKGKV